MSDSRSLSTYAYPSPASHRSKNDLSLREILDTYRDNNDLLAQILATKAEEDKRKAEEEKFRTEQLRLQCKQLDLEMMREQRKPPTIFTGVPPLSSGFSVKSPSETHSPFLNIPPPIDTHFSATTPTSARLSPPSSATPHENVNYGGITNPQNHTYSRPSLTLSIPPFQTLSSPTAGHSQNSFSQASLDHNYTQSPTSATSAPVTATTSTISVNSNNKRPKPSEPEVDHEYVMEALRQKVRQNAENPARKYMKVLKPRSVTMPVGSSAVQHTSPTHHHHHHNHQLQHPQGQHSPVSTTGSNTPVQHSPISTTTLPPMNVHSPGIGNEQGVKS
ncbi:2499_t:CDS:2 [Paraglomus occultum]|uniref:2499_t:CDS:1 n=1 Tax=Paraglomus occultum TaxID=144539 RepID=A0A9N8WBH9_9GLOM|nr:2499_t:CDS:2 [Paraglomus occultum]